ncbi:hypothetical protein FFWV33_01355 [Flavobacterium faecale]|uniref:DUF4844 domain-containing protein n=1 Tax=Flavobacterium faecale TaxID=1355330 RepID=A0A2S1L9A3_9FLAO|nr:DUF4844 domain-containing protein [Flavobacterium faecale]AWG20268.1 hypothetical protein FFWV33_01355 [Flavobacterium faecale]
MSENHNIVTLLNEFRNKSKFSAACWEERGLNPSNIEVCDYLENIFNDCSDHLIKGVQKNAIDKQLKKTITDWLNSLSNSQYDTEELEFICDYFYQLAQIVEVDLKDSLNVWNYGKVLNNLFKITSFLKGKENIIATLKQHCTDCNALLETFILKKEAGIPDHNWHVVRCNKCKGYNLLSLGPNIKELRYGEYQTIEQLAKASFNKEQAMIRLKQIKIFRKN